MTLHNEPGASAFEHEIGALRMDLDALDGVTITADNAPNLRDVMARATALTKRMEAARKDQKQPHLDAGRAVDADYKPWLSDVASLKNAAGDRLTPFLRAEQERQQREAEAARKLAEQERGDTILEDRAKAKAAQASEAPRVNSASGLAKAASLRTFRYAKVTDAAKLVAHFADDFGVIDAAEKAANAKIRAAKGRPLEIPGIEIIEEQKAV